MADVVVETDRLRLRTWDVEDRAEFIRRTNTPAVMRWLGGAQEQAAFDSGFDRIDSYQRDFGHTLWVVERKREVRFSAFAG